MTGKRKGIIIIGSLLILLIGVLAFNYEFKYGEVETVEAKSEYEENNYIQAPHFKIAYSTMQGLKIPSVYDCDKMAGSSMQPAIFTGNTVCSVKYSGSMKNSLREGMIVTYIRADENDLITHRIKAIYDDYIRVQGDNVNYPESVDYEDIREVVVAVILT